MSTRLSTFLLAALTLLALLLGMRSCSEQEQKAQYKAAFEAVTDTVRTYRNKQGQLVTSIAVLKVDRAGLLAVAAGKDKQLAELQKIVAADKNITSATVFHAVATGKASGATKTLPFVRPVLPVATADTGQAPCPLPTYQSTVSGDGFTASITAGPDSTTVSNYKLEQDYSVAVTSKRKGLFKPKVSTVEVTALTPGGVVTAVRSYELPNEKPRRGAAAIIGGIIAAVVTAVLLL
jgi:hypothetical protein